MKYIPKGKEPAQLLQYRKQKGASYSDFTQEKGKGELQQSLLDEQGYICCYCMQRISLKNMKVEHFIPQTHPEKGKEFELIYSNLLGACEGNEGYPKHLQHCDTSKADTIIHVNPVENYPNWGELIKYRSNGEVHSDHPDIDHDLNKVLNLNEQKLVNNRKAALDATIGSLSKIQSTRDWSKEFLQRALSSWENADHGRLQPFCGIVIAFLRKKLARIS